MSCKGSLCQASVKIGLSLSKPAWMSNARGQGLGTEVFQERRRKWSGRSSGCVEHNDSYQNTACTYLLLLCCTLFPDKGITLASAIAQVCVVWIDIVYRS